MRKSTQERFWEKVQIQQDHECWEWLAGKQSDGYGAFRFAGTMQLAHRVAYKLAKGAFDETLHVLHRCDNPGCVNPAHLFLGTNQDNVDDKVAKNRQQKLKGVEHGRAKLTEQQVVEIRARYAAGNISQAALGREYGVHHAQIHYIVKNKLWKHLKTAA